MKHETQNNNGYTLIEMIVAIAVFAVAITISLAAFLNVSDIQRKTESLRVINDNLNFSLEIMMREIRAGSNYSAGGASLSIKDVFGNDVIYSLGDGQIKKSVSGGPLIALTSKEVNITKLFFIVRGQNSSDGLQPMVTIIISGSAGEKEKTMVNLDLQTTISQRKSDS